MIALIAGVLVGIICGPFALRNLGDVERVQSVWYLAECVWLTVLVLLGVVAFMFAGPAFGCMEYCFGFVFGLAGSIALAVRFPKLIRR